MNYRVYDRSEPHGDIIGVSLWGPGQALPNMSTVSVVTVAVAVTGQYFAKLFLKTDSSSQCLRERWSRCSSLEDSPPHVTSPVTSYSRGSVAL